MFVLLTQVTTLSRLRHPCILEVVEPVEETRQGLYFATEPITSSLRDAMQETSNPGLQLDDVEVRKGFLQLARALEFLHDAQLIHTNVTPYAVLINTKGDWKLAGASYLTRIQDSPLWAHADDENALPPSMQHDGDYMDPHYVLDHVSSPSNDMYSLGVLLYTVVHRGTTPYQTHGTMSALRSWADRLARADDLPWPAHEPELEGASCN